MTEPILLTSIAAAVIFILAASLLSGELRLFRWLPAWTMRVGHFVSYALFGFLLTLAMGLILVGRWLPFGVAVVCATAFGGLMELLQSFRPGRTPDWTDALINAVGAGLGSLVALFWSLR